MSRPATPSRLSRMPNLTKRGEMRDLITQGVSMSEIALRLGYKNAHTALVMATKWKLNTLRAESRWVRAGRQPIERQS